ncbi:MAG: hypothetical protein ACYDG4_08440 [Desulfuromonadaceae bacterium]
MKRILSLVIILMMYVMVSSVNAGHDHGSSQGSQSQETSQAPVDAQNAKESETLLKNCAQYVDRIEQHIRRLQAQIKDRRVGASVHDEIKKLEEHLKDANDNARSLQIM